MNYPERSEQWERRPSNCIYTEGHIFDCGILKFCQRIPLEGKSCFSELDDQFEQFEAPDATPELEDVVQLARPLGVLCIADVSGVALEQRPSDGSRHSYLLGIMGAIAGQKNSEV